jgi:hypothetical protein
MADDSIAAPTSLESKKMPTETTSGRIGDQISHEMLEELAPNGEGDYILDKINNMTEEEAIAIIQESRKFIEL